VPVMSLGIRSGELDPAELQRQRLCQRVHHEGLRQPGHPFEDAVAPCEDGHQELFDDVVLSDDLPRNLLADLPWADRSSSNWARSSSSVVVVLKAASFSYRWKTGRNLNGSCKMMAAMRCRRSFRSRPLPRAVGVLHADQLVAGFGEVGIQYSSPAM